jgi:hypothetical protein
MHVALLTVFALQQINSNFNPADYLDYSMDESRLSWRDFRWLPTAEIGGGFTSNTYYEESGEHLDFPLSGKVVAVGELDRPTYFHHHWLAVPFEVYPLNSNQSHVDPLFGLDLGLKPIRSLATTFRYNFQMNSDPATFKDGSRQSYQDHVGSAKADFYSKEDDYGVQGEFKLLRRGYEDSADHLSHTRFSFDARLYKPVYPESHLFFEAGGMVYRYDQPRVLYFQKDDSRWIDGAAGFDGTIGRDARLLATLGLQIAFYDELTIYEPRMEVSITERFSGDSSVTAGFRSQLRDSTYGRYARDTSLYFHTHHIFFDSWKWIAEGEYTYRNFVGAVQSRADHFLAYETRVEFPWHRLLSFYAEGRVLFNLSDALANIADLSSGEDRFAAYDRVDFTIGVRSTY